MSDHFMPPDHDAPSAEDRISDLIFDFMDAVVRNEREYTLKYHKEMVGLMNRIASIMRASAEAAELLRRVNHTLCVHGHVDAKTPLADQIENFLVGQHQ